MLYTIQMMLDLETVYSVLKEDWTQTFIMIPPATFYVDNILVSMKVSNPITPYAESQNSVIDELVGKKIQSLLILLNFLSSTYVT